MLQIIDKLLISSFIGFAAEWEPGPRLPNLCVHFPNLARTGDTQTGFGMLKMAGDAAGTSPAASSPSTIGQNLSYADVEWLRT